MYGGDWLDFYIGGSSWTAISGEVDWTQVLHAISSRSDTLTWCYVKSWGYGRGDGCLLGRSTNHNPLSRADFKLKFYS